MKSNEIIIYQAPDCNVHLEAIIDNDTIWLTQAQMALLFGTQRPAVTKHLNNIYNSGELNESSVCSKMEHTASDGKIYRTKFYNLDAIISVGYRVNSINATQFRIWATKVLKEYMLKGFSFHRPASIDELKDVKDKLKEVQEDLERQISNCEAFTEEQISEVYKTIAEMFSRKQLEEKPRKPIGFLLPKQKTYYLL